MNIDETAFKYDEIKSYFDDYILDNGEYLKDNENDFLEELHNYAFNQDYYMIGTYQAKKWCEDYVFDIIECIRQWENDVIGEVSTDFSEPEKVVNMYTYIVGEHIVYKWREQFEFVQSISKFLNFIHTNSSLASLNASMETYELLND